MTPSPREDFFTSGLPFSATQTSVRTLPNGVHQSFPGTSYFRDSEGRTRKESPYGIQNTVVVEIHDPVAGFAYILDATAHTAHKLKLSAKVSAAPKIPPACPTLPPRVNNTESGLISTSELLGSKTIKGVSACGMKMTTTYPAGSYLKNEKPVSNTSEVWNPAEPFPVALLAVSIAGVDGSTTTIEAADLSFKEPDPSLFLVPGDYQVVEETGAFTFALPKPSIEPPPVTSVTALTGMPFSAEIATAERTVSIDYRDSLGRTRRDTPFLPAGTAVIFDSVAGVRYLLDPVTKTAKRYSAKVISKPAATIESPKPRDPIQWTRADGTVMKYELLGTKIVEGIEAYGTLTTITNPVGTRMGNDTPIVSKRESWFALKLGLAVSMKFDGQEAASSTALRNLKFIEPDPALFRVPEGYRVVDAQ